MPLDPRAHSSVKLTAPSPLPHVSRKALRRVKDFLPAPTACHYCNSPVALASNDTVYGREYGEWPYLYRCTCCDAYVGLHPDTDLPLGTLANKALREARKVAKNEFFDMQRTRGWGRNQAYKWLAEKMDKPVGETHFGWFNEEDCYKAATICLTGGVDDR